MDAFDWGKIKNGFSGFEKLAVRFVNDQFSVSRPWTQTKKTRDGNRDAYTIVLGYQAYPAKEEQWWMEAKYSTAVQKLTRYKLDATIVSAILNGNVSKVIFVTNILVGAKTVQDIRTALKKAVNCKDVSFCTNYTLEFLLRQNPEVLLEFFEGTAFRFNFPDLFITEEPEFYSKIDRGLTFREPLHILQRNQQYSACFSVFSAKKCVRKIRTKKDIQGLTLLSRAQLSLHPGENHICISFRLERDYKGGNGTNEHSAPVFLLGDAQLLPKYAEVVDGTEITIRIKSQEQIREEIDTLFTEFQLRNQLFLYCIRGVSGSGKTYLLKQIAQRFSEKREPLFYADFTSSSVENSRILLDMVLFILFPYLDPETVDIDYINGLTGCYVSSFVRELIINRKSLDTLNQLFAALHNEDALFPVQLSINARYVFLDNLQCLNEAAKNFLLYLLLNAKNCDLPVVFILSGQPDFFAGEFELVYQRIAMQIRECALTAHDIEEYLQTCGFLRFHPDHNTFRDLFPNLIELFLFAQYLNDLGHEVSGLDEFLLACKSFCSTKLLEQCILDRFNQVLTGQEPLRALCDNIYWSESGVSLATQDAEVIQNTKKLLKAGLIQYDDDNRAIPYHDIYKNCYRKHFSRPKSFPPEKETPLEAMCGALWKETDRVQLWRIAGAIADMLEQHKFYSAMYVLEGSFRRGNLEALRIRLGTQIYYTLYMCYALAATNVSTVQSGRELFQLIRNETKDSGDPILLDVCESATWELLNSLYEWLEFDQASICANQLIDVICRLQLLGRRETKLKKCIRYHDAEVIRTLVESEQNFPAAEENFILRSQAALDYGFQYRYQTFKVRYGLTLATRNIQQACALMSECMRDLEKSRGQEDRYYLWAGFALHYLKLVQKNDSRELSQALDFHGRLKKNFYNDYRKKIFGLASFYYCVRQVELGNHLLFQEVRFERDLRPRQKAFYFETVALYESLYGSLDEAQNALHKAEEIFAQLPDYLVIIRHNLRLLDNCQVRPQSAKFYCGGELEDHIYYADPRSAW